VEGIKYKIYGVCIQLEESGGSKSREHIRLYNSTDGNREPCLGNEELRRWVE